MSKKTARSCSNLAVAALLLSGSIASAEADELDRELRELLEQAAALEGEGIDFFRLPQSFQLDKIPQDPKNPLTHAKVALGKLLYHETGLATLPKYPEQGYETYSCASCHFAQAGFQANLPQGVAEGGFGFGEAGEARSANYDDYYFGPDPDGETNEDKPFPDVQPIRSPTVLNGAYQELMLWNGQFGGVPANNALLPEGKTWDDFGFPLKVNALGFEGLETQALAGLEVHRMLKFGDEDPDIPNYFLYRALFKTVYHDDRKPMTQQNVALAIAAFERTVLANKAPWQQYLRGRKKAMTEKQKRGAIVFFGEGNCVACHTGPALNSMEFHALGMPDLDESYDDRVGLGPNGNTVPDDVRKGRGGFEEKVKGAENYDGENDYKFKTPQLYNLIDSPFYGHGATYETVEDVIDAHNNVAMAEGAELDSEEMDDLVAFIEEALYDPDLMRYVPKRLPTGYCTPVNDPVAQADLIAEGYCKQ